MNRRQLLNVSAATAVGLALPELARASSPPSPWPTRRLLDLLRVELPIVQAPMGGHVGPGMPPAVCAAGGLGSLPCAGMTPARVREEFARLRAATSRPLNLNFFCHAPARRDQALEAAWRTRLAAYYAELGVDPPASPARVLEPFGAEMCDAVAELRPEVASFHFGWPGAALVERLRGAGIVLLGSATTVAEARWLEDHGADAVIAQGAEAGGHRGMFLTGEPASQLGTLALVPLVADAVRVPVIAAGGIADGRGIAAALALGASGVQMGTAYLLCPEARVSTLHRDALRAARERITVLTNVMSGRPARMFMNRPIREAGPFAASLPDFPLPAAALAPLRVKAEARGSDAFSALYAGQAAPLCRELPAGELTAKLAAEALERLAALRRG